MSFDNLEVSGVTSVEDWVIKYNALVKQLKKSLQGELNLPLSLEGAALLTNGYNNLCYIEDTKLHLSFLSTFTVGIYPCRIITITGNSPTKIKIGSMEYPLISTGSLISGDIIYLNFYTNSDNVEVCETLPTLTNIFSNESLSLIIHGLFKSEIGGEINSALIPKLPLVLRPATQIRSTAFQISYSFTDEIYSSFEWIRLYYWKDTYNPLNSPYISISLDNREYLLGSSDILDTHLHLESSTEYTLKIVAKGRVRNYESNEIVTETAGRNSYYITQGSSWTAPRDWVSGTYIVRMYSGLAETIPLDAASYARNTNFGSSVGGDYSDDYRTGYYVVPIEQAGGMSGGSTSFGNFTTDVAEGGLKYRYRIYRGNVGRYSAMFFQNGLTPINRQFFTDGLQLVDTFLPIKEQPQQVRTELISISRSQTFSVNLGTSGNNIPSEKGYITIERQT